MADRILFVTVHGAEGLKNQEMFGKSDPYCLIKGFNGPVSGGNYDDGREGKTVTKKNDLSPQWEETHAFLIGREVNTFVVKILDEDTGIDDLMANVRVVIDAPTKDCHVNLKRGSLHVSYKVCFLTQVASLAPMLSEKKRPPRGETEIKGDWDRVVVAHIQKAEGLKDADFLGKSDPYVVMRLDGDATGGNRSGGKTSKTRTLFNTCNPEWGEIHGFMVTSDVKKM